MSSPIQVDKDQTVTVTFQDHGQDFLEWDIQDMTVVGCRPFQAWAWVGKKIHTMPALGQGQNILEWVHTDGSIRSIRYPVVKIQIKARGAHKLSSAVLNSKVVSRGAKGLLAKYKEGATS